MRRCSLVSLVALSAALLSVGCGRGSGSSARISSEGVFGQYYYVNLNTPPIGGIVTSDVGGISCGASSLGKATPDANGVLHYNPVYYPGADHCGQFRFAWSQTVVLTATPQGANAFVSWSGDCGGSGTCTLKAGADKTVMAIFGPRGSGHPNFLSPADHGPAYLSYLGKEAGALNCPSCHGAALGGQGIAPSCHACHAQAGWTGWQTNCSFCHGARTAQSKAGYDVQAHPAWSAPPDAISQRLTGTAAPARAGAHQAHLLGATAAGQGFAAPFSCATCHGVPGDLGHVRGAAARAAVTLSGAGQGSLPAALGSYDPASGTCTTYCHGASPSPAWGSTGIACGACHGLPPPAPHFAVSGSDLSICAACHSGTVRADGTLDVAGGKHVNGVVDVLGGTGGSGCAACHGFPPTTGAHAAHYGLSSAQSASGYGDVQVLQDRFPDATPASAPAVYAFGCGNCHPVDSSKHMNGKVDVPLYEAAAPAGSLKARNAPTATYDRASGTCSGVYCHSSGQAGAQYAITPAWTSGAHLGCTGCHDNPPRYQSGGAASATANSHVNLAEDGWEFGHFNGLIGPWLASYHGGAQGVGDSAPITCQTCHFETTDPANTGPSGFYYLDTTGNYQLPGGDATRLGGSWYQALQCTYCHAAGRAAAPLGTGKVLPLRHVNGKRDVTFDPRTTLPALSWLPPAPNTPTQPYWLNPSDHLTDWPSFVVFSPGGRTVSFSLASARYDPATKTCTNVACHMAESPVWGKPYAVYTDWMACAACHPNY